MGCGAIIIAIRALVMQRFEIIKNGRRSALIHASNLIQQKIEYHNKIIGDCKSAGGDFKGHAHRINSELRPLKQDIDFELLDLMNRHDGVVQAGNIRQALSSKQQSNQ